MREVGKDLVCGVSIGLQPPMIAWPGLHRGTILREHCPRHAPALKPAHSPTCTVRDNASNKNQKCTNSNGSCRITAYGQQEGTPSYKHYSHTRTHTHTSYIAWACVRTRVLCMIGQLRRKKEFTRRRPTRKPKTILRGACEVERTEARFSNNARMQSAFSSRRACKAPGCRGRRCPCTRARAPPNSARDRRRPRGRAASDPEVSQYRGHRRPTSPPC